MNIIKKSVCTDCDSIIENDICLWCKLPLKDLKECVCHYNGYGNLHFCGYNCEIEFIKSREKIK